MSQSPVKTLPNNSELLPELELATTNCSHRIQNTNIEFYENEYAHDREKQGHSKNIGPSIKGISRNSETNKGFGNRTKGPEQTSNITTKGQDEDKSSHPSRVPLRRYKSVDFNESLYDRRNQLPYCTSLSLPKDFESTFKEKNTLQSTNIDNLEEECVIFYEDFDECFDDTSSSDHNYERQNSTEVMPADELIDLSEVISGENAKLFGDAPPPPDHLD